VCPAYRGGCCTSAWNRPCCRDGGRSDHKEGLISRSAAWWRYTCCPTTQLMGPKIEWFVQQPPRKRGVSLNRADCPSRREITTHESAGSGREQHPQVGGDLLRLPLVRACRSLGGCVTSTACSAPPVRPADNAGRGSAPRSSRMQETFLTSAVRWRETQGTLPRAQRRLPTSPHRRRWSGPEAAGLLPNAESKLGVGASSVSRALAEQDDEAPYVVAGASAVFRVLMDECG
jgi:hypothetical protein